MNRFARIVHVARIFVCLPLLALVASCTMYMRAPLVMNPEPGRFEKKVLHEGMTRPMELEVLPDGSVLFVELPGDIHIYHPETEEVSLAGNLDVFTEMENGLLGLALDPDFEDNNWIYLFYSPKGLGPKQHVSRFDLVDGKVDMDSEKIVLEIPTQRDECCHQAGALEFGPNGDLYISTGDNTNPFASDGFSPSDYREDRSPWDAAGTSANTNDLRGKILRIHPEPDGSYSIPDGNLFPKDDKESRPEIYVMGCRNPFRFNVDPETGFLYWGEVGPDSRTDSERGPKGYDEINQARAAGNFGWPFLIADNKNYAAWDFEAEKLGDKFDPAGPLNASPNNTGREILPPGNEAMIFYPYVKSKEFPEVGEGGRTACAGPVYHYEPELVHISKKHVRLPSYYDNCLFIYEWERGWIKAVKLDANSNIEWIEPFMPGEKFLRPVDMQFGPEGDLYVLEYGSTWGDNEDSKLVRLQYIYGNRNPVAIAEADTLVGRHPLTVDFDATKSTDKDEDDLAYRWKFEEGFFKRFTARSKEPQPTHTFKEPGTYEVELTAKDPSGDTSTDTVKVLVGNTPPEVTIKRPTHGAFYDLKEKLIYDLYMEDAEDGDTFDLDVLQPEVFLNVVHTTKKPELTEFGYKLDIEDPAGLTLMKSTNCFNCHAVKTRVVGPAFVEIADKYKDDRAGVMETLIGRVQKGSTGVWGEVPMLPHESHTRDEIAQMVEWVLDVNKGNASTNTYNGTEGRVVIEVPEGSIEGLVVLTASYTDHGAEKAERLSGQTQVLLRSRRLGAQHADKMEGITLVTAEDTVKSQAAGTIGNGDYLFYESLHLDDIDRITYRVASRGTGGLIQMRLGAPDGEIVNEAKIERTGDWNNWVSVDSDFDSPGGVHDVYFMFENPEKESNGMFNLNWIEFHPEE